jgi:hypothetical protein
VVEADFSANEYVPAFFTHFDTSNFSAVSVAFGVMVAMAADVAGAFAAVIRPSDQELVTRCRLSRAATGRLSSGSLSTARVTAAPPGSAPVANVT